MAMPVRRIIAGVDDNGRSSVLSDGPPPDVYSDPARPGFTSARVWVTDASPAKVKGVRETVHCPRSLSPPPGGSVLRCIEFPPEASYIDKISAVDVAAYFSAMGSPEASTATNGAPHPYMQQTPSLDFCYVLDGAITLVLDTGEVHLAEGDTVIQRGANHAWSNRSSKPARVLISQHDGAWDGMGQDGPRPQTPKTFERESRPLRRVLTGRDAHGRSGVVFDSENPNKLFRATGSVFNELWTVETLPAPLDSPVDYGSSDRAFAISPPDEGLHWRITMSPAKKVDPKALLGDDKKKLEAAHANDGAATERRDDARHWGMHRTPSVDYAICLDGKRILVLEDYDVTLNKGDIVIQLGNWHSWENAPDAPGMMAYIMIAGELG